MTPSRNRGAFLAALAAAGAVFLSGCMSPAAYDSSRMGPFFRPTNLIANATLGGIRRVVLLPIWGSKSVPEDSLVQLDPIFREALQKENRFEIVTLSREDCLQRFGAPALSSAGALPHDFMATLARVYGADAVMFIDVTVYRAYPPLSLGVRSKLATINGPVIVWAFDNVFSADNPQVANAARHSALDREESDIPGDPTLAALQSPSRFATYVANATFTTLPPVTLAQLTQTSRQAR